MPGGKRTLLPVCKNVERSGERKACLLPLREKGHKRGYISVACSGGHQWVWCSSCCDCAKDGEGCTFSQHWFERDSFDTGKRNHMQRHNREGTFAGPASAAVAKSPHSKRQRDPPSGESPAPMAKSRSTSTSRAAGAGTQAHGRVGEHGTRVSGPTTITESPPPHGHAHHRGWGTRSALADAHSSRNSIDSSLARTAEAVLSFSRHNHTGSFRERDGSPPQHGMTSSSSSSSTSTGASPQLTFSGEIRVIQACKHMERKQKTSSCPCEVNIRLHKRGYLAVGCTAGHQYVWCSCCCDCRGGQGIGCSNPLHWTERDFFDTGKRNHMQRHQPDYDAVHDEHGTLMATIFPRQVAMPRKVRSTYSSPTSTSPKQATAAGPASSGLKWENGSPSPPASSRTQQQPFIARHVGELAQGGIPAGGLPPMRECLLPEAKHTQGCERSSSSDGSALEALADAALGMLWKAPVPADAA